MIEGRAAMPDMFDPIRINGLELPNRIVRSATFENMAVDGKVSDELVSVYRELARGEIGLIVAGSAYVRPDGYFGKRQTAIYSDDFIPGLKRMVDAVHEEGGRIAIQIHHVGRRVGAEYEGTPVSPSAVTDEHISMTPRALTGEEVHGLAEAFVLGAHRAMEAGFDAVQLHAAHGFMLNQFISPHTNRREDEWGGSTEGRIRFIAEILRKVRAFAGLEYPILIKQGIEDYVEGGLRLEEGVVIARRLCEMGMDAVEPSAGVWEGPAGPAVRLARRGHYPMFLEQAAAVRSVVDKPVMVVGGLRDPRLMQQVLDDGKADMLSMCRPFIREPHILLRWKRGDFTPTACISCALCNTKIMEGPLRCRQDNP